MKYTADKKINSLPLVVTFLLVGFLWIKVAFNPNDHDFLWTINKASFRHRNANANKGIFFNFSRLSHSNVIYELYYLKMISFNKRENKDVSENPIFIFYFNYNSVEEQFIKRSRNHWRFGRRTPKYTKCEHQNLLCAIWSEYKNYFVFPIEYSDYMQFHFRIPRPLISCLLENSYTFKRFKGLFFQIINMWVLKTSGN